jgi:hypothetical protein
MISPGLASAALPQSRVSPGFLNSPDPADFEGIDGLEVVRVTLTPLAGRR